MCLFTCSGCSSGANHLVLCLREMTVVHKSLRHSVCAAYIGRGERQVCQDKSRVMNAGTCHYVQPALPPTMFLSHLPLSAVFDFPHAKPQFSGLLANRMVGSLNFFDVTSVANGPFVLF